MPTEKESIQYVNFYFFELQADRFWRQASPAVRGLYWSLITDIYTEGGRLRLDYEEIKGCVNWSEPIDGEFKAALDAMIKAKFTVKKGFIYQKRVTKEMEKAIEAHQKKVKAGKARAATDAPAVLQQCSSSAPAMLDIRKETNRNEETRQEKRRNEPNTPASQVKFFTVFSELKKTLNAITQSDTTNLHNILKYLFEQEGLEEDTEALKKIYNFANACKTARKPMAVFNQRIKNEFNWRPASAAN
jgi:hypothetical protein